MYPSMRPQADGERGRFIHATGIYFFTKGFLLTRLVLEEKSSCAEPPAVLGTNFKGAGTPETGCWHPKTFDKAVVVIIDALRYDFTVPFNNITEVDTGSYKPLQAFHNALPFLYDTALAEPHNAFLLPFIADPPTTTLQRLKGLTTGTLPTFIDAGSNFAGTAIEEDNLLMQMRDVGKKMVHLGDDTWTALFPGYFEEGLSHAYDSFNVWDLHTVDNGVTEHIMPLLTKEKRGEWDVVFAHYLGVDHAGHRYGPDHPAMTSKLRQMNEVLREIVAGLADDTLLVVMGDHGMDAKGDHGGESDDEIEAALWMYSKKGVFGRTDASIVGPPATAKDRPVAQIDLVPTLALLLGLPIPFNNLGKPIAEAFAGKSGVAWDNLAAVARMAAAGVKRYLAAYYTARGMDEGVTPGTPHALWQTAQDVLLSVPSFGRVSTKWQDVHAAFSSYQEETLRICKGLWARFDVPSMLEGILIMAAGIAILIFYARGMADDDEGVDDVELDRAERQLELEGLARGEKAGGEEDLTVTLVKRALIGTAAGLALGPATLEWNMTSLLNSCLLKAAAGGIIACFSVAFTEWKHLDVPRPTTTWGWMALIFTIAPSIGFASNSYTIWEDSVMLFFISTFGFVAAMSSLRQEDLSNRTLGVYHSMLFVLLGWVASFSRLCREEQMPYCRSTYYASATSSTSAPWQLLIPFTIAALLPSVIKSYYQGTRSYHGFAQAWISYAVRAGLFLSAIFWTFDAIDDSDWFPSIPKETLKSTRILIAQSLFVFCLAAGTTAFAWAPPCVSISTTAISPSAPQKRSDQMTSSSGARVTILGYANTHGTHYVLLLSTLYLLLALVQKPMGALSLATLLWQILSLLEITDTNALRTSPIIPTMLALLGSFHFFKTGHQATLASIQWESAFVASRTIVYPWSPLLVVLNTFGAQILCAAAVPLVVLWKAGPKEKGLLRGVARSVATFALWYAVVALATTMWAGWLRRHLMLYRIFSPRWMVGGTVLLVIDVVGVVVALMGYRWNHLAVAEVFGWA